MASYAKKNDVSKKAREDALKIARGIQRPGQTKEQTKLISQGIQKGIEQYKKQQKVKARERDRYMKKSVASNQPLSVSDSMALAPAKRQYFPWVILGLSWLVFIAYVVFTL